MGPTERVATPAVSLTPSGCSASVSGRSIQTYRVIRFDFRAVGILTGEMAMANSVSETEGDIDWEVVRSGLNKRIRLHLDRVDPHEREDLVQEAFVGVLRQARRGPIRNLEGLLTTVAHGVCTDFVRRRTRWRSVLEPLADHTMQHSVGPTMECSELGDPRERAIFLASEFFAGRAKCQQIWEAKVQKKSLATLANELRVSDTAIRQRWTDCLKRLRSALAEGGVIPTFLGVFHELN